MRAIRKRRQKEKTEREDKKRRQKEKRSRCKDGTSKNKRKIVSSWVLTPRQPLWVSMGRNIRTTERKTERRRAKKKKKK